MWFGVEVSVQNPEQHAPLPKAARDTRERSSPYGTICFRFKLEDILTAYAQSMDVSPSQLHWYFLGTREYIKGISSSKVPVELCHTWLIRSVPCCPFMDYSQNS